MRGVGGQASVEYLGIYAWAFLGLLVTIGALSYFGIFDPSNFQIESCQSGSKIVCQDFYLAVDEDGDSELLLTFKNNYPQGIVIDEVHMTSPYDQVYRTDFSIFPGGIMNFRGYAEDVVLSGKENLKFTIKYRRAGGINPYTTQGQVLVDVQRASRNIIPEHFNDGGESSQDYCGDWTRDPNEDCDQPFMKYDTALITNSDCPDRDHINNPSLEYPCNTDCTCMPEYCGDGIKNGNEQCEPPSASSDCRNLPGDLCVGCLCTFEVGEIT